MCRAASPGWGDASRHDHTSSFACSVPNPPPPFPTALWVDPLMADPPRYITTEEILAELDAVEPEQVEVLVDDKLGVDTRPVFVTKAMTKRYK